MSIQQEAVFTHDNTPTSRKARTIENRVNKELTTVVRKIRANINPLQAVNEIETKFKPLYGEQVYDIIRVAAQEIYIVGTEYVNNLPIFKNLQSYLILEDIHYIEEVSEEYSSRFWGRVALTATRGGDKSSKIFGTNITISKERGILDPGQTFINPNFIIIPVTSGLIYTTLNQATVRRIRYNVEHINPLTINIPDRDNNLIQGAPEGTQDTLILSSLISTLANVKLIWTTSRDERVDQICRNLEGAKYTIYDQFLQIPPIHYGCRCRLMVIS